MLIFGFNIRYSICDFSCMQSSNLDKIFLLVFLCGFHIEYMQVGDQNFRSGDHIFLISRQHMIGLFAHA